METDEKTHTKIWVDGNILRIHLQDHSRITLDDVTQAYQKNIAASPHKKPVLLVGKNQLYPDGQTIKLLKSKEIADVTQAVAIVLSSAFEKQLFSLFLLMHKTPYPVKNFENEADALNWLKTFITQSVASEHG